MLSPPGSPPQMPPTVPLGIVGASGPTGSLVAKGAAAHGFEAIRLSRTPEQRTDGHRWFRLDDVPQPIETWVYLAAIWKAEESLERMLALGARRIVVVSSTSKFTKVASTNPYDTGVAAKIDKAETDLKDWASRSGVSCTILRPTLIYGPGSLANLRQVARVVDKVGFFPIAGAAAGLRQPISTADLAEACLRAAKAPKAADRDYNIGGGEVLTYRQMVRRVMQTMGRRPRTPSIPLSGFRLLSAVARVHPRLRHWTPGMAERMNVDMVFDNTEATRDFGYAPGRFVISQADIRL